MHSSRLRAMYAAILTMSVLFTFEMPVADADVR
jgi:hypothetical protein